MILAIGLLSWCVSYAQMDEELDKNTKELIENLVEENDTEFDYNFLFEKLEHYSKRKIQLNKATADELKEFGLLSDIQIIALLRYREEFGELISIYELQAIDAFDKQTILGIMPFVKFGGDIETFRVPVYVMPFKGTSEFIVRYSRILEERVGYVKEDSLGGYLGNPGKLYARFRHQYENRHSWGITAEKDAGEEFFTGSNKAGFDFYSAHLYYRNLGKFIKGIAIGDYEVSFGQGLTIGAGFGAGKSSYVTSIKLRNRTLKPYTSVAEANFRRGLAAHFSIANIVDLVGFVSMKNYDFALLDADARLLEELPNDARIIVGALDIDGLHRTTREIDRKNNIPIFETGGGAKLKFKQGHVGAHGVYTSITADSYRRTTSPYNQFSTLDTNSFGRVGMDYNYVYENFNFFGETGITSNNVLEGGFATLNGLLIGLDRTVDLAILHRYYGRGYVNLVPSPAFAESTNPVNEAGLYLGLSFNPSYNWTIAGYMDSYRHPWLRFFADAPSTGVDYLFQVNYRIKRKLDFYVRYKSETKQVNLIEDDDDVELENEDVLDLLANNRRTQVRFHLGNKLNKTWELRNRLEYMRFKEDGEPVSNGFLVYQDVLFSPIGQPYSFKGRFAIFQTDNYDSRIYAYENDIIGSFSIPAYAYTGLRYYLTFRYKGIRNMTIELRAAQTYLSDRETISSGNEQINGPSRTEVKAQIKYKF